MTRNTDEDDSTYRLDRRTVMKLASAAGLGAVFGTVSGTADASGPAPIDPDREPPWDDHGEASDRWVRDRWFVAFDAEPRVRGETASTQAAERARFRADVRAEGLGVTERRDFTRLWNGLSVTAAFGDAVAMTALESVAAVYPVAIVDRPDPADASPMLETALSMTGVDESTHASSFAIGALDAPGRIGPAPTHSTEGSRPQLRATRRRLRRST